MGHWALGWAKGWKIFAISLLTLELCLQGREHVWPCAVLDRRRCPCFLGSRQTGHILLLAVALLTYSLTYIFWLCFRATGVVPLVACDKLVVLCWVQGQRAAVCGHPCPALSLLRQANRAAGVRRALGAVFLTSLEEKWSLWGLQTRLGDISVGTHPSLLGAPWTIGRPPWHCSSLHHAPCPVSPNPQVGKGGTELF